MKQLINKLYFLGTLFVLSIFTSTAQQTNTLHKNTFNGLELRSIGPSFMSGRIADIAIHPKNENIWYIAVGSGGVWKTQNSGTTWKPVFDKETSYSIGTVSIDPNNPEIIWVGTGEDVGGRHVGFGDGVYKSTNGGKTWENMGLKNSQHISKVIVHPENSNVVWVASEGPLWNQGGERGLYKSINGGETWKKTLGDEKWTGVTEVLYDPRNPDRMYAATWQRHRTVAAYIGNGPGSAIFRSDDGGDTWEKLTNGLPKSDMGKTGLAISPQNPDVLYAAIELDRRKGAVYRSEDGGSSWTKQSNTISGGTGPHYYQELFASPHQKDRLYLMDNTMQISEDGGKTFYRMNKKNKHGDNHAIAFKKEDPNYLIVGTDGGLYESFDLTKTWKYIANLPVTQFYKIAVDDAEPFYNIYGGTQDNSTEGGPSRTDNLHGIQNSDWRVILNWDGHQPATEPGNPNIVYAERQEGTLSRLDMKTGEAVDIQPQVQPGDDIQRFNWDAPILVSPHKPSRIYFASQRVWKSENRGDSWTSISKDLTKNQERITLPIMGKQQSWDNAWDVYAMSNYNTITSLAESPKQEGLLYAGTDDGFINITENGGSSWKQIKVSTLPGVPETAFVNDIKADLYDANTVYIALDNHKYGDFKPYLFKSTNKGKTWTSLSKTIPENHLVWRFVQDHKSPNLFFIGTEFGLFFSNDGGQQWVALKGNVPTISFRDLAIQKRENDLVAGSFGRGFYIFDDYSSLRTATKENLNKNAKLFPVRDAWWYIERSHLSFENNKGSQGDAHYVAPNPDFGALITYYIKEVPQLLKAKRQDSEKRIGNKNIPFPGWDSLEKEKLEQKPKLVFVIKNEKGEVVRNIFKDAKAGINRISWDLRYPNLNPILLTQTITSNEEEQKGFLVAPGKYSVSMFLFHNNSMTQLDKPTEFNVKPLYKNSLKANSLEETTGFWRIYETASRTSSKVDKSIVKIDNKIKALQQALLQSTADVSVGLKNLESIRGKLNDLKSSYYGNQAKLEIGEKNPSTVNDKMFTIYLSLSRSTYGPTDTNKKQMQLINSMLLNAQNKLTDIQNDINNLKKMLKATNAPYIDE